MRYMDLAGTSEETFEIGEAGPKVRNNAGAMEIVAQDGSTLAPLKAGSPTNADHLANKSYVDGLLGTSSIALPIADDATAVESTATLAAGQRVYEIEIEITEVFNGSATLVIGDAAAGAQILSSKSLVGLDVGIHMYAVS